VSTAGLVEGEAIGDCDGSSVGSWFVGKTEGNLVGTAIGPCAGESVAATMTGRIVDDITGNFVGGDVVGTGRLEGNSAGNSDGDVFGTSDLVALQSVTKRFRPI
jgi:hypothetical protein